MVQNLDFIATCSVLEGSTLYSFYENILDCSVLVSSDVHNHVRLHINSISTQVFIHLELTRIQLPDCSWLKTKHRYICVYTLELRDLNLRIREHGVKSHICEPYLDMLTFSR